MGRLLLVILIIVVIVVLWRAFGPSSWKKQINQPGQRTIVAPDDDPDFLWKLEKEARERRKAQREQDEQGEQKEMPEQGEAPKKQDDDSPEE